jgi:hypothetical protein
MNSDCSTNTMERVVGEIQDNECVVPHQTVPGK